MDASTFTVTENLTTGRFELQRDGELVSFAAYHEVGANVLVPHVETLAQHRGQDNAARLMAGLLDQLRASGRTITPICSFARDYLQAHPEQHDLVHRR